MLFKCPVIEYQNEWGLHTMDHVISVQNICSVLKMWYCECDRSCWQLLLFDFSHPGHVKCQRSGVVWDRPLHHQTDKEVRQRAAGGHMGHPAGHHRAPPAAHPGTHTRTQTHTLCTQSKMYALLVTNSSAWTAHTDNRQCRVEDYCLRAADHRGGAVRAKRLPRLNGKVLQSGGEMCRQEACECFPSLLSVRFSGTLQLSPHPCLCVCVFLAGRLSSDPDLVQSSVHTASQGWVDPEPSPPHGKILQVQKTFSRGQGSLADGYVRWVK